LDNILDEQVLLLEKTKKERISTERRSNREERTKKRADLESPRGKNKKKIVNSPDISPSPTKKLTVKILTIPETVHYNAGSSPRDIGSISPRSTVTAPKSILSSSSKKAINDDLEDLITLLDSKIPATNDQ